MRWGLIAIALLSGCTIQRDLTLDQFACGNGGPCDGGVTVGSDGAEDATPGKDVVEGEDVIPGMDGETPDAGPPLAACPKVQPLPPSGLISGITTGELNSYESGCSAPGGPDTVYGFNTVANLRTLTISTAGSNFDTALHLYRDDCTPLNRVTCNDEHETAVQPRQSTSFIELENVPPGNYAVVVDGFGSDQAGTYVLKVTGTIAPGEPCNAAEGYLTCEIGMCPDLGGPAFCPAVLDCLDGIDADEDGTIDEDTCVSPPVPGCNAPEDPFTDEVVDLIATLNASSVIYREWRVVLRPDGSFADPFDVAQEVTGIYPDMAGSYVVRYRVADSLFQLSACEVSFAIDLDEELRVELIWNDDGPQHEHHSFLNLHLLHPNATRWFDTTNDCASPYCINIPHEWGQQGDADDPWLIGLFLGPQWASVYLTQDAGTYGIGVEYEFDNFRASSAAVVNVYCYGELAQTLGPVFLQNGRDLPPNNDFWKVAEVDMSASGCQVIPYLNGGMPIIITGGEAMSAR